MTPAAGPGLAALELPARGAALGADGTAPLADDAGPEAVGDEFSATGAGPGADVVARAVSGDAVLAGLPVRWSPAACTAADRVGGPVTCCPGGTGVEAATDGVPGARPDVGEPRCELPGGGPVSGSGERLTRVSALVADADRAEPDGDADAGTGEVTPAGVKKDEDGCVAAPGWPGSGRVAAGWPWEDGPVAGPAPAGRTRPAAGAAPAIGTGPNRSRWSRPLPSPSHRSRSR
jgi:hypothetical protein